MYYSNYFTKDKPNDVAEILVPLAIANGTDAEINAYPVEGRNYTLGQMPPGTLIHSAGYEVEKEKGLNDTWTVKQTGGGGGGEPAQYIKTAAVSADGNTLTLTDKSGTPIVFAPEGGGGGALPFGFPANLVKLTDYGWAAEYLGIDYDYARKFFLTAANTAPKAGGCSAIRKGRFFARSYDWQYSNMASVKVSVPAGDGRYASTGTSGAIPEITDEFLSSGEYSDLYKLIPFVLVDGRNSEGLTIAVNVVPSEGQDNRTVPTGTKEDTVCSRMLIRYLLDRFATAKEACNYVREHVEVYFPESLHAQAYEVHFLVCDKHDSLILEFVDNAAVIVDCNATLDGRAYMTNFLMSGVTLNADGTVYTPATQDASHDAIRTNGITDHGAGLERYNLIAGEFDSLADQADMLDLLKALQYTKAYNTAPVVSNPYWYTEFVDGSLTCASAVADFASIVAAAGTAYTNRNRAVPQTWQSVHAAIYDIESGEMWTWYQEDYNHEFKSSMDEVIHYVRELPAVGDNGIYIQRGGDEGIANLAVRPQIGDYHYYAVREGMGAVWDDSTLCYTITYGTETVILPLGIALTELNDQVGIFYEVPEDDPNALYFSRGYSWEEGSQGLVIPRTMADVDVLPDQYFVPAAGAGVSVDPVNNILTYGIPQARNVKFNADTNVATNFLNVIMRGALTPTTNPAGAVVHLYTNKYNTAHIVFNICCAIFIATLLHSFMGAPMLLSAERITDEKSKSGLRG